MSILSRPLALISAAATVLTLGLPAAAEPLSASFGLERYSLADRGASPAAADMPPARPALAPSAARAVPAAAPIFRRWMSPEIRGAWNAGFRGQNTRVVVVDDFRSTETMRGNLGGGERWRRHGEWTRQQVTNLAPGAEIRSVDFNTHERVIARDGGLTVVNLSYTIPGYPGTTITESQLAPQERSLWVHARRGTAVLVQSAGNSGIAMGGLDADGLVDYLALGLLGSRSVIYVGALNRHGTVANKASLSGYSNRAGNIHGYQDRFLTVGVREDLTGMAGTSFAAPIVSGYAAVLGSKFRSATPAQIANRLLDTARTDTIRNYRRSVHGRGEASVARAIAPSSIR